MLVFPNAKINLGLRILRKRPDGFHDLETCMYPIAWHDALEIIKSDKFSFTSSGFSIDGNSKDNLVIKAYHLLKKDFDLSPVKIHLHKAIPMGAGLGGGSADAAFAIKVFNGLFELKLSAEQMKKYASQIGSDCAFFIDNIPSVCTGRGEIITPVNFSLKGNFIVMVKPDVHVSTAEAYSGVKPKERNDNFSDLLFLAESEWKNKLHNDFEDSVFSKFPRLAEIKKLLLEKGAYYVAMSGSGSTIFGLFKHNVESENFKFSDSKVKCLKLS